VRTFDLLGEQVPYYELDPAIASNVARYNWTAHDIWNSERRIEVAIGHHFLQRHYSDYIFEFGNTMSQYVGGVRVIVDLTDYEYGAYTIDIMDFHPGEKFDSILSISTFEHVGMEDGSNDLSRSIRSVRHVQSMLRPGGEMLATWALGYNHKLDQALFSGVLGFNKVIFYRRLDAENNWQECDRESARDIQFFKPFPYANGIFVGYYYGNESNHP
jgi:hypothetical protein